MQAWLVCVWTSREMARMPDLREGAVVGGLGPWALSPQGSWAQTPIAPGAPAGVWAEEWQGPSRAFRVSVESLLDRAG